MTDDKKTTNTRMVTIGLLGGISLAAAAFLLAPAPQIDEALTWLKADYKARPVPGFSVVDVVQDSYTITIILGRGPSEVALRPDLCPERGNQFWAMIGDRFDVKLKFVPGLNRPDQACLRP